MRFLRSALTGVALLGTLAGTAGCNDATGPGSAAGTYTLERVNGQRVPYTLRTGSENLTFLDGQIRLERDGRFDVTLALRIAEPGLPPQTDSFTSEGDWELEGTTLFLDFDDDATERATLSRGRIVLTIPGDEFAPSVTMEFQR